MSVMAMALAIFRIHIRVQKTLIGYEIGQLKREEAKIREQQSHLKMQLAKITTKKHLMTLAEHDIHYKKARGAFASK